MSQSFLIRQAQHEDVSEIVRIWTLGAKDALGRAIEGGNTSYEKFFYEKVDSQDEVFQIWVAVDSGNSILGWQSLSPITNNPAARNSMAESSTYVLPNFREEGIAKALVEHAKMHAKNSSLEYIIAFVQGNNYIVLNKALDSGWKHIGTIPSSPKSAHPIILDLILYIVPND